MTEPREIKGGENSLFEEPLEREILFTGRVLSLARDTVRLPNGNDATREVVLHGGAVAVLPLLSDGSVLMERQYRHAQGRTVFEIPAGKLDSAEEDPLSAAHRELREETGASASKMTYLGVICPSVAILTEKIHLYLAEGLSFGERALDEDEFLTVESVPLQTLLSMVMRGDIQDAKTIVAVMKASYLLEKRACEKGNAEVIS